MGYRRVQEKQGFGYFDEERLRNGIISGTRKERFWELGMVGLVVPRGFGCIDTIRCRLLLLKGLI